MSWHPPAYWYKILLYQGVALLWFFSRAANWYGVRTLSRTTCLAFAGGLNGPETCYGDTCNLCCCGKRGVEWYLFFAAQLGIGPSVQGNTIGFGNTRQMFVFGGLVKKTSASLEGEDLQEVSHECTRPCNLTVWFLLFLQGFPEDEDEEHDSLKPVLRKIFLCCIGI